MKKFSIVKVLRHDNKVLQHWGQGPYQRIEGANISLRLRPQPIACRVEDCRGLAQGASASLLLKTL